MKENFAQITANQYCSYNNSTASWAQVYVPAYFPMFKKSTKETKLSNSSVKRFYGFILLLCINLFLLRSVSAQTTETFESFSLGTTSFTSGSVPFTLNPSSGFKVNVYNTYGYLSSNNFIDNITGNPNPCQIKSTSTFCVKSLYLYPSTYVGGDANQTVGVNVTFTGKLANVTKFTYSPPSTDFAGASWSNTTNRGFSLVNFATPGYENIAIDELVITLGGTTVYFAIDNFTWATAVVNVAPTVTTQAVSSIAATTATGNGNITSLGVPNPTAHGVCWNTTGTPTTSDSKVDKGAATATGAFTASMTSLTANTTYYVRAFATNTAGTAYGTEVSFTTASIAPTVTTQAVSSIAATTATGNGNITSLGVPNPTAHGVCWNTTGTPTTSDSKVDKGAATATGAFTASMTSLTANTTYYVRAFATNTAGTSYGTEVSFTTNPPVVTFIVASSNGLESVNSANLQVDLNTASGLPVTVDYAVTGTASGSGVDYTLANGTLTIIAGATSNNITIAGIVDDLLNETNETVIVTLSNPTNASLGTTTVHTYTITDNDAAPTITFNTALSNGLESVSSANLQVDLNTASGLPVTVDYTVTGTASGSGVDYTLADGTLTITAGATNNNITIAGIVDDLLFETNETVIVTLSNPTNASLGTTTVHTYTITDNDVAPTITFNTALSNGLESVSSANLQVDLNTASGLPVTVDYTVTGTASGSGVDYTLADGTLTITAGATNNNITIAGIVDDLLNETNETVIVTLSNPTNASLGTTTVHTYTITDNDAAPTIAFNSTSSSGLESVNSANLQVDLNAASGLPVTVDYAVTGTASGSGVDYTLANGTLTITAGATSNNITIAGIVDDLLNETNETVIVTLSNPTNASLGTTTVHTYTITDNDAVPTITFNTALSNGLESVSSANLQVDLNAASGLPVTVDYAVTGTASSSGVDYTLANGTLTITAGATNNNITIAGIVDDLLNETNETVIVTLSNPTNASLGTTTVHTYTITDNDAAPTITFNTASSNGLESISSANLQVDLSAISGLTATVDYTVTGTATGSGVDYTLADGTLTIGAGSTSNDITIAGIIDDLLIEGDETVIVTLSNPVNATLGSNTVHTYTITDNDFSTTVTEHSSDEWNVYPNPVTDYLHFSNVQNDLSDIIVNDLMGNTLLKLKYSGEDVLDLSKLPTAVYMITFVKTNGDRQSIRVVKE